MERNEILKIYNAGSEAVVNLVQALVRENTSLQARLKEIESRLSKDSHNSSKPPSSDNLWKKFKKVIKRIKQKKTGKRKPGGQKGHIGKTLEMVDNPTHSKVCKLKNCKRCGKNLEREPVKGYERRQEFEVEIKQKITEYQAEKKECPDCEAESTADFPEGIKHKTQYGNFTKSIAAYFRNYELIPYARGAELFEDIFDMPLCESTLVNISGELSGKLGWFEPWIINRLINSSVVNFDESGININKDLHWLHNASNQYYTYYFCHSKRGNEAMDAMGILPYFMGTAVHDHWKPYFNYKSAHALCNAHHKRELIFIYEEHTQKWAKRFLAFLLNVKEVVEKEKEQDKLIDKALMRKFEIRYTRILNGGFKNNPPPEKNVGKRGKIKKSKALNLLERLRDYKKETLAFMYEIDVPFDNNQGERDIRMMKLQQKISGLFRSKTGAENFCRIRSFISTLKKQKLNVLDSIYQVFQGNFSLDQFSY